MFLSNRDIQWAIRCGKLIVEPRPELMGAGYDDTSIDLHLDSVAEAKIWDVERLERSERTRGGFGPEIHLGRFDYRAFSDEHLISPPKESGLDEERKRQKVCMRGEQVIVKPGGFLLWTTKERVGTPSINADMICFVEGKSTRARTGIVVHLTAPTIHAAWTGKITLEIANLGPFHFVLQENDVIAQLTVATVSSPPDPTLKQKPSATQGQKHVSGDSGAANQTLPSTLKKRTWFVCSHATPQLGRKVKAQLLGVVGRKSGKDDLDPEQDICGGVEELGADRDGESRH